MKSASRPVSSCFVTPFRRERWTSVRMRHARSRVLSLQAVDRGRTGARLLDDDGSGADEGSLRGSAGRVATAARDRRRLRRTADLRLAQLDHVLAALVLLLRPAEAELSRGVRLSSACVEGPPGAPRGLDVEDQGGAHDSDSAPRRSRSADYRLVARSL